MSDQPFQQQDSSQSTRDVAMEETKSVGQDAKQGAKQIAQTAGAEAQAVVGEAKAQVTSLYDSLRQDVQGQARDQTQRAAGGLRGIAGEFTQMADGASGSGMASGLVRQAAERIDGAAGWLDGREPGELLEEVRRYARRRPGTFLAACAVIGFVGGRLTRGLRDEAQEQQGTQADSTVGLAPVPATWENAAPGTTAAPEPMSFEGSSYGGRPTAVPGGTVDVPGVPAGAGTTTSGPVGTAAGNPLPSDTAAGSELSREAAGEATVIAGDGEDVYTDGGDRR